MEENLKKNVLINAIDGIADNYSEMKEILEKEQRKNVRLGMEIQKLKDSYYWIDLVKFLKGEYETEYSNYFGKVKPLYDEFGYITVNKLIIEIYDEERAKEQEAKKEEQKDE